ncbi:MAG: hypothetical protein U1C55_08900 [Smithellaceae bacterium]|nr:hypothetical protein [Smithellaceae bacterium]
MKISRQSLIYLLLSASGIGIYIVAGLLPLWLASNEYTSKNEALRKRLEIQKIAMPQYREMEKRLSAKPPQKLSLPSPAKIPAAEINQIRPMIQEVAQKNNLSALRVEPDMLALIKGTGRMAVVTELKGRLFDFRNYLIALNGLPYVTEMAEMEIRQTNSGLVFVLKFYIEIG